MDYEKEYKAMVQRAKELYKDGNALTKQQMEIVCPELAESEDERIRKWLIEMVEELRKANPTNAEHNGNCSEAIAYLENQEDANKEYWRGYREGKQEILDKYTEIKKQKDQKPVKIHIDNPNVQKFDQDMKVTTSDSSADGKALLYVSNKSYNIGYRDGVNSVKSAEWSEEDKKRIKQLIYDTEHIRAEYEKRKKELGESFNDELIKDCDEQIAWLKSLCPHWKPSEEQMEALKEFVDEAKGIHNASMGGYTPYLNLQSLYNDLKKL